MGAATRLGVQHVLYALCVHMQQNGRMEHHQGKRWMAGPLLRRAACISCRRAALLGLARTPRATEVRS